MNDQISQKKFVCNLDSLVAAVNAIGGKMEALILYVLYSRILHFGELKSAILVLLKNFPKKLKELQADGLVLECSWDSSTVEYSLTDYAKDGTDVSIM